MVGVVVIVGISVADGEVEGAAVARSFVGVSVRDGIGVGEAMSGWIVRICTWGLSSGVEVEEQLAANSARPKRNSTNAGHI